MYYSQYFIVNDPYILSMPLILTAITPTIYRIIIIDSTTRITTDNNRRSAIGKHCHSDNGTVKKENTTTQPIKVVSWIVTYIIPCILLLLYRNDSSTTDQKSSLIIRNNNGTDAIFTAVVWHPLTTMISQWPCLLIILRHRNQPSPPLLQRQQRQRWLQFLVDGGPFGYGCQKIIHVVVGGILWKVVRGTIPPSLTNTFVIIKSSLVSIRSLTENINGLYTLYVAIILAVVSSIVTVVLSMWLRYTHSNGESHTGLNTLLRPTKGRPLHIIEHVQLAILATMNAICEECTSRGFWRHELERTAGCNPYQSNLIQGMIFGVWHYFGIPNGWTGVVLTTIYGWIMGNLSDWTIVTTTTNTISGGSEPIQTTGLLLPIIMHSIADYYIFTVLARQTSKQEIKV